jgi:hypothetical protein
MGVLSADGDCQVALTFLNRLQQGFCNSQSNGANIAQRPKSLKHDRDTDDGQQNQRVSRDRAFVNNLDEIEALLRHVQSFHKLRCRLPEIEINSIK